MNKRLLKFTCLLGALAGLAAAASSYDIKFYEPVRIGSTELKPGDYKLEMQGDKAVFKSGKNVMVEVPATVGKSDKKYSFTSLLSEDSKLNEIDLGGTNMRIVLAPAVASGGGSK